MTQSVTQILECYYCGRKVLIRKLGELYRVKGCLCYNLPALFCSEECAQNHAPGHCLPYLNSTDPAYYNVVCDDIFEEKNVMEKVARSLVCSSSVDYPIRLLELLHKIDPVNDRYLFTLCKFLSSAVSHEVDATKRGNLKLKLDSFRKKLLEFETQQNVSKKQVW